MISNNLWDEVRGVLEAFDKKWRAPLATPNERWKGGMVLRDLEHDLVRPAIEKLKRYGCAHCDVQSADRETIEDHLKRCPGNPLRAELDRTTALLASARALSDQRGVALASVRELISGLESTQAEDIRDLIDTRLTTATTAETNNEKMLAVLSRIQWFKIDVGNTVTLICPSCMAFGPESAGPSEHRDDCAIAALLKTDLDFAVSGV